MGTGSAGLRLEGALALLEQTEVNSLRAPVPPRARLSRSEGSALGAHPELWEAPGSSWASFPGEMGHSCNCRRARGVERGWFLWLHLHVAAPDEMLSAVPAASAFPRQQGGTALSLQACVLQRLEAFPCWSYRGRGGESWLFRKIRQEISLDQPGPRGPWKGSAGLGWLRGEKGAVSPWESCFTFSPAQDFAFWGILPHSEPLPVRTESCRGWK